MNIFSIVFKQLIFSKLKFSAIFSVENFLNLFYFFFSYLFSLFYFTFCYFCYFSFIFWLVLLLLFQSNCLFIYSNTLLCFYSLIYFQANYICALNCSNYIRVFSSYLFAILHEYVLLLVTCRLSVSALLELKEKETRSVSEGRLLADFVHNYTTRRKIVTSLSRERGKGERGESILAFPKMQFAAWPRNVSLDLRLQN